MYVERGPFLRNGPINIIWIGQCHYAIPIRPLLSRTTLKLQAFKVEAAFMAQPTLHLTWIFFAAFDPGQQYYSSKFTTPLLPFHHFTLVRTVCPLHAHIYIHILTRRRSRWRWWLDLRKVVVILFKHVAQCINTYTLAYI